MHEAVHAVAAEIGASPAVVLGHTWLHERARTSMTTIIPVIGARTVERLTANLAAREIALPPAQFERIEIAGRPDLGECHDHNRDSVEYFHSPEPSGATIPVA